MSLYFNQQVSKPLSSLQERALKEAYTALYAFAGAKPTDHFVLTSSGAEAVNHAVFAAYVDITRKTGKNHFLCSTLDESPTILAMSRLQELACVFQMVPATQEGMITAKEVAGMITPRTAMLSMSWANGLTGVLQPVLEIAEVCRERDILFHVEASHVLGKGDFSLESSGADLLSFQGVRQGMGGLFIREGVELSPLILGGNEQGGMRGGMFNFSELVEWAKWAQEEKEHADYYSLEMARLRSRFEELILASGHAYPLFQHSFRVPHICSFIFPGIASEALSFVLSQKGLYTSFGGNQLQHFAHILKACGISQPDCHSGLSFALPLSVTEEEIEKGAAKVLECVKLLKPYSQQLLREVS